MLGETIITENTGVSIGVILGCIGGIWWAATMNSKVDMLLKFAATWKSEAKALESEIESVEKRVTRLEEHSPGHNVMKALVLIVAVLILPGCGHSKRKVSNEPTAVSRFAVTPLPVPPPPPDPAPVAAEVVSATAEVTAAQSGLQNVVQMAQSIPAAAPAVSMLQVVGAHLAAALQHMGESTKRVDELKAQIVTSEENHKQDLATKDADIERLKADAVTDAKKNGQAVAALQKENEELRDESIRQAKTRLLWLGIGCLMGMAGCIAGTFYGFAAGPKLAGVFAVVGVFLITISQLLQKIVFFGECAAIGVVVLLIVWAFWHAFHHPAKPIGGAA